MMFGYIDPGQGMLIWQAIVSAFVGVLFYLKKTRQFIAGMFRKVFGRQDPDVTLAPIPSEIPVGKAETKAEMH